MSNITIIDKGATDQTVYFDATDEAGLPLVLTDASAGLALKYTRTRAAPATITAVDLASTSAAHSDAGLIHVGGGRHRLDLPDAAVASGVPECHVTGVVTGGVIFPVSIILADPSAAAIRAAVGMASANLDTQLTAIDDAVDTETAAIKAQTDKLTFDADNALDANAKKMNSTEITGTGTALDKWRGA